MARDPISDALAELNRQFTELTEAIRANDDSVDRLVFMADAARLLATWQSRLQEFEDLLGVKPEADRAAASIATGAPSGAALCDPDREITRLRDGFLLASIIGRHDSPKVSAMVYDAVVDQLGQPGVGYDPLTLFRAKEDAFREANSQLREACQRGPDVPRAEGWF